MDISLPARASLDLAPVKAPAPTKDQAAAIKAAEEFEAVFIAEILGAMFEGVKTDGPFGGGFGEDVFRSLLLDRYGRSLASQGGFGIADAVKRQLLSNQEQPAFAKATAGASASQPPSEGINGNKP
jgi:Rod binding domain-containing protein